MTASMMPVSSGLSRNMMATMKLSTSTSPRIVTRPGGEQVVEHVDVGGDARHQAADRIAVVEGDVEPLQVRHQLAAQIEHGELAGVLHQVRLRELAEEGADQHAQVEQTDAGQAVPGIGRQIAGRESAGICPGLGCKIAVDRDAGEQRTEHLQGGLHQQKDQRERHQQPVGPHVAQQAAHQPGVVCFTEDLFFHLSSSSLSASNLTASSLSSEASPSGALSSGCYDSRSCLV